jgi:hypothetical protein
MLSSESQPDRADGAAVEAGPSGAATHMSQLSWLAQSEEQARTCPGTGG